MTTIALILVEPWLSKNFMRQALDAVAGNEVEVHLAHWSRSDESLESRCICTSAPRTVGLAGLVSSCLRQVRAEWVWILVEGQLPCWEVVVPRISAVSPTNLNVMLVASERLEPEADGGAFPRSILLEKSWIYRASAYRLSLAKELDLSLFPAGEIPLLFGRANTIRTGMFPAEAIVPSCDFELMERQAAARLMGLQLVWESARGRQLGSPALLAQIESAWSVAAEDFALARTRLLRGGDLPWWVGPEKVSNELG